MITKMKKRQILVIGVNDNACTPELQKVAYQTGCEIARSDSVLITGGLGGVMQHSSHGAHDCGGLVVGIIPQNDPSSANEYCDIVIPSGMGYTRDFLTALSADGVIVIGGGVGTLTEACAAYMFEKPIVVIRNTGGSVSQFIDGYLDHRKTVKIAGVDTPKDAVDYVIKSLLH